MIAVLAIPPLLVRGILFEVYAIQSNSMEPSFVAGDQLLVLQEGADLRETRRWDVVVVDRRIESQVPDGVDALIKRVVGLPDEWLRIEDGDVWIREAADAEGPFHIARKDDELISRLLVVVHEGPGLAAPWSWRGQGTWQEENGSVRLGGGAVAACDEPVDDGFLGRPGDGRVGDTAVRLRLGEADGVLTVQLREGADVFRARLAPEGATLWHNLSDVPGGVVDEAADFAGLSDGAELLMWNVDNGVRVRWNGTTLLAFDYPRNEPRAPGALLQNGPQIEAEAGSVEVVGAAILRDLHYTSQGLYGTDPEGGLSPSRVPPGGFFLLGDASRDSRDSRYFGPVPGHAVRGRPMGRFRPWARAGWLDPAGTSR